MGLDMDMGLAFNVRGYRIKHKDLWFYKCMDRDRRSILAQIAVLSTCDHTRLCKCVLCLGLVS